MNENMFYHSSSKLIINYYSALLFAILFFVLPTPCTPIFTVLYTASHELVLCLCDTVILVLCWYDPATSKNLLSSQYCYSFFWLLKPDFQNRARVFKTLHTISTTTHPISKTLQILCKIKHSCKTIHFFLKTTLCYHMKHTRVTLLYSVCTSYTLLW